MRKSNEMQRIILAVIVAILVAGSAAADIVVVESTRKTTSTSAFDIEGFQPYEETDSKGPYGGVSTVQLESNTEAYFNPDNLADGGALLQSGFYQEPDYLRASGYGSAGSRREVLYTGSPNSFTGGVHSTTGEFMIYTDEPIEYTLIYELGSDLWVHSAYGSGWIEQPTYGSQIGIADYDAGVDVFNDWLHDYIADGVPLTRAHTATGTLPPGTYTFGAYTWSAGVAHEDALSGGSGTVSFDVTFQTVPEPEHGAVAAIAAIVCITTARRKRQTAMKSRA
jgi:hypothetical protein